MTMWRMQYSSTVSLDKEYRTLGSTSYVVTAAICCGKKLKMEKNNLLKILISKDILYSNFVTLRRPADCRQNVRKFTEFFNLSP